LTRTRRQRQRRHSRQRRTATSDWDHAEQLTFSEVVVAMQARLGRPVKLTFERQGRIRRTAHGRLKPGLDSRTELVPEDDGALEFKVGDQMAWSRFLPFAFTGAQDQPDHRLLRVEMGDARPDHRLLRVEMGDASFVIETAEPAEH
jgi:hypothetical protein